MASSETNGEPSTDRPASSGTTQSTIRAVAETAKSAASAVGSTLNEAARPVKDAAGELADDMTERAKGFAETSIGGLAGQVNVIAQGLNETADALHDQKSTLASELTRSAAGGLERVASHLETSDLRSLARDVEDFARARPALFIGGAIALGFVLGRFLRSGSEGRYDGRGSVRYSDEGDRYASTSGYRERYGRDHRSGAEYDRGMTDRATAASPASRRSTSGTDLAGDRNAG